MSTLRSASYFSLTHQTRHDKSDINKYNTIFELKRHNERDTSQAAEFCENRRGSRTFVGIRVGHVLVQVSSSSSFELRISQSLSFPTSITSSLHYSSYHHLCPILPQVHIGCGSGSYHTSWYVIFSSANLLLPYVIPKSALSAAVPLRHLLIICDLPISLPFCC